jgi:hypothetical protein
MKAHANLLTRRLCQRLSASGLLLIGLTWGADARAQSHDEVEPAAVERPRWAISIERSLSVPTEVSAKALNLPVPGLGVTYRISERIAVQVILAAGYAQTSATSPLTSKESQAGFSAAGRLHVQLLAAGSFRLGLLSGAGYRAALSSTKAGSESRTQIVQGFGVELGLRPEWFFSERVSVHTAVGPVLRWSREDSGNATLGVTLAGDVLGQLGLSVWF